MADENATGAPSTALSRGLLTDSTQAQMATRIFSGASLTSTTVATGDLVLIQDVDDANNIKTVTAQSIANLGPGGTVTSVSGTANRITSTGGATPVIDIAGTYVGQSSITTLGTITTGVWNGTTIALANGGTGATTASGARTNLGLGSLATLSTINNSNWSGTDLAIVNGGTGASDAATARTNLGLGSLSTLNTINDGNWSGTDLSVANGGTGRSSHTAYAVICGGTSTTNPQQSIASVGTSGQVLTSNGAGALPTFQNAGSGAGLVFLASASIMSDATVDFDNCYSATYNTYRWKGARIITATDSVDFNTRVGTGGGPTYQNGASDYAWSFTTVTTSASGDQDQSDSEITLSGATFTVGNAAGEQVNFDLTAYDPFDSSTYYYIGGTLAAVRASTGSMLANCIAARYLATTSVNSQQFFASSGNLTSGIIKLFGEVNS